jgi:hypothetical protein
MIASFYPAGTRPALVTAFGDHANIDLRLDIQLAGRHRTMIDPTDRRPSLTPSAHARTPDHQRGPTFQPPTFSANRNAPITAITARIVTSKLTKGGGSLVIDKPNGDIDRHANIDEDALNVIL